MDDAISIIVSSSAGVLAIWTIIRFVNKRPIDSAIVPLVIILLLAGYRVRDGLMPVLNQVLPWMLSVGGCLALIGDAFFPPSTFFMGKIVRSQRFCRWGNRLCGPDFASNLQTEWERRSVFTARRKWSNIIGSLLILAAGIVWMALV